MKMSRPRIAVHKFSSCDGCQLAFLNLGDALVELAQKVDIVHFAEAGYFDEEARVDISFVEGSISTPDEVERIHRIREQSNLLISIGACATSGGLQALRNLADTREWIEGVYASPEFIHSLENTMTIASEVKVDFELWGCPVNSNQIVAVVRSLLMGAMPRDERAKLCLSCKREQKVCVMVTRNEPCLGPVTRTGCGALCPSFGRGCFGCYGPVANPNTQALANRFRGFGLLPEEIACRFLLINSGAPSFALEGKRWQEGKE